MCHSASCIHLSADGIEQNIAESETETFLDINCHPPFDVLVLVIVSICHFPSPPSKFNFVELFFNVQFDFLFHCWRHIYAVPFNLRQTGNKYCDEFSRALIVDFHDSIIVDNVCLIAVLVSLVDHGNFADLCRLFGYKLFRDLESP